MNHAGNPARGKVLLGILVLGALLRFPDLGHKSIWGDEATSIYVSIGVTTANDHPPGYYFLSSLPVRLFGLSEFSMRLTAAIFGLALIWGVYKLGEIISRIWRNFPANFGSAAALLAAVSPYYIQLSQENRPYSMIAAITAWSCYFFLLILERKGVFGAAEEGQSQGKAAGPLGGYIAVTALGLYSHYFVWLVLLTQGLFWLTLIVFRPAHRRPLLGFFWVPLLLFILFLPILPSTIAKITMRAPRIEASIQIWSLKYYLSRPISSIFHFATGYFFVGDEGATALRAVSLKGGLFALFVLIPGMIFLAGLYRLVREAAGQAKGQGNWEAAGFILGGLTITLVGAMTIDTSIARQHSISGVFFFLVFSLGILGLKSYWRVLLWGGYSAILIISLVSYYALNTHPFYRSDWRAAVAYLKENYQPGDQVYVSYAEREGYYSLRFCGFDKEMVYAKRPNLPENQPTFTDPATGQRMADDQIIAQLLPRAARLFYVAYPDACHCLAASGRFQIQDRRAFGRDLEICLLPSPPK